MSHNDTNKTFKYTDVVQSDFFIKAYADIELLRKDIPRYSGIVHINNVLETAKKLAKMFELTQKETRLLLIAVTLHDIGYLEGPSYHHKTSAQIAQDYLTKKSDLTPDDINRICSAISCHRAADLFDFKDRLAACLILAEKSDYTFHRFKPDIIKFPENKAFLSIKKIEYTLDFPYFTMNIFLADSNILNDKIFKFYVRQMNFLLNLFSIMKGYKTSVKLINIDEK